MFQSVIFDLDGTLLDTIADLGKAGNCTLATMGLPPHNLAHYKKLIGNGIRRLVHDFLPAEYRDAGSEEKALEIFTNYYENHMLDLTAPYPGILPFLQKLRDDGYVLSIVSNKNDNLTKTVTTHYFTNLFTYVAGAGEAAPPKPDPASTLDIVKKLGLPKESILFVGDSRVDMITAANSGLVSCGVTWGFKSKEELLDGGAKFIANSPAELDEIIRG